MRALRLVVLAVVLLLLPTGCDLASHWLITQLLPEIVPWQTPVRPPPSPAPVRDPVPDPAPDPEPDRRGVAGPGCTFDVMGSGLIECNAVQAGAREELDVHWFVDGTNYASWRTNYSNLPFSHRPTRAGVHVVTLRVRSVADGTWWEVSQAVDVTHVAADDDDDPCPGGVYLMGVCSDDVEGD